MDAVLTFHALDKSIMRQLVEKQLKQLNERLKAKKVMLRLDKKAYETLEEQGYDHQYGARPLQSVFQRLITRPLSKKILEGNLEGGELLMSWDGHEMRVIEVGDKKEELH
jgi:ATP-dependent Clp protease ATP-binding subunit ClpB